MIVTAYTLGAELPLVLRRVPVPQLPPVAGPAGLALEATGLALRAWSMRTLGTSYTRTLRTEGEQHVVDSGPYRLIRHPGRTTVVQSYSSTMTGPSCGWAPSAERDNTGVSRQPNSGPK